MASYYDEKKYGFPYFSGHYNPSDSLLQQVKSNHAAASAQLVSPIDSIPPEDVHFDSNEFHLSSSGSATSPNSKSKRDRPRSHTPRPSNSFILYRREKHIEIMQQYKGVKTLNNNVISKIVANMWRQETPEVKAHFAGLADAEKRAHMLKYPDYKYRPRKTAAKKAPIRKSVTSAKGQEKMIPMMSDSNFGNGSINYMSQPYMVSSYPVHHMLDQTPRMPMMEREHEYDLMSPYGVSPTYEHPQEFLSQDAMLNPTEYNHSWPIQPGNNVWDLGMEPKPFASQN
jgi:hypothetical protein